MQSVFSHLVRTRLATESENVASEALGFIQADANRKLLPVMTE
jgi:hypothetical protein